MPTYAWEARTRDRKGRDYMLRGSFYIASPSVRAATEKMRHEIQERHNGEYISLHMSNCR